MRQRDADFQFGRERPGEVPLHHDELVVPALPDVRRDEVLVAEHQPVSGDTRLDPVQIKQSRKRCVELLGPWLPGSAGSVAQLIPICFSAA
ncbi:hypothetical protein [Kribbella sp. NBC_00359]|uniref:hypothetical protein n=1 Tax=Kribbella sp. NBC_00359 TaxID=2975966 RepID=UPI002E1ED159